MLEFEILFMYFFIYSVLGWVCEMIFWAITHSKITNTGFMYGPYSPIYGLGGVFVVVCLEPFLKDPIIVFFLGMIAATVLEYITSFLIEKAFNAKWWDYSHLPFNINGRVCLYFATLFGFLGLFTTYIIHPHIKTIINNIPEEYLAGLVMCCIIIMIIDFMSTLNTILNLKSKLIQIKELAEAIADKKINQFNNIELIKQLEELKSSYINKSSVFYKRILEAFPSLEFKKLNNQINELKIELHKRQLNKKIKNKKNKEENIMIEKE